MEYYNRIIETMPREEMRKLQSERLADCVKRAYDNVAPYRAKMDEAGIQPGDIKSIDDLNKLPFTTKQDLRGSYPYGMFAVPMDQVVRIHATSGTTGKQTVIGYTAADLEMWGECVARCIVAAGGSGKDILHVSYGYGLFTGGLGLHYGGETLGCAVIPVSASNTKRQVQILEDFGSTILCCTPSYALYIAETMREMGVDVAKLPLRIGIFGAESWTENMRREIEALMDIKAYDIFGMAEVLGPGVAIDCTCQNGMHVMEDHFLPEIIDPDTGEQRPEGEKGELVFTCLTKQALPLIRYRTRDITSLNYSACGCGRTLVRIARLTGRSDDMLIIRGVNVFPSQIESVLLASGSTTGNYMIIADRVNNLDTLEVQVELSESLFSDEVREIERANSKLADELQSVLSVRVKVTFVQPKTITRSEGKAKRVIDKRVL